MPQGRHVYCWDPAGWVANLGDGTVHTNLCCAIRINERVVRLNKPTTELDTPAVHNGRTTSIYVTGTMMSAETKQTFDSNHRTSAVTPLLCDLNAYLITDPPHGVFVLLI